jgi:ribonuclease Z
VFETDPRRPFLAEKADILGVPFGPERRDLVNGNSVTLANGKTIHPDDVLGPLQKGTKLVVVGDTGRTDNLVEPCRDADALVIESTYMDSEADMARQFSHMTAKGAAELAAEANVKKLILTHLSRRYNERDMLKEARSVFPNAVVARDFDTFKIKRE